MAAATCGPHGHFRQILQKRSISAGDDMRRPTGGWLFWSGFDINRSMFDKDMRETNSHFIPSDLDLWPSELKFAPIVTLVQRYVSTKLEVSTAFLFRENLRHGQIPTTVFTADWTTGVVVWHGTCCWMVISSKQMKSLQLVSLLCAKANSSCYPQKMSTCSNLSYSGLRPISACAYDFWYVYNNCLHVAQCYVNK